MLVYGDRARRLDPRALLASIRRTLNSALAAEGVARRDRLTDALIQTGELVQGLADAEFEQRGEDDATPLQSAALAFAVAVAGNGEPDFAGLERMALPPAVTCKEPEGYAHYAVYPEAYAAAARSWVWPAPPFVIGLRSIGASLAAAVASVAPTGGLATLRPIGHPFRREIRASHALRARLAAHRGPFVVVDEGPGLSGSSFAAAATLLEGLGVSPDRIVFMPSHGREPGGEADPTTLARWRKSARLVAAADDIVAPEAIAGLFADLTEPAFRIEELSAGRWTCDRPPARRPPVWTTCERIKVRLTTPNGAYIARFAGLGGFGAEKLARAEALFAGGYTPEPLALRRGFLLERWVPGGGLDPADGAREPLIEHLGRYLGFRARHFPADSDRGADRRSMTEMALVNADALGGPELQGKVAARLQALRLDNVPLRPVYGDGRLHPWEWVRGAGGRLVKTDALDHACGHDLVGAQDIAWDIAGANVEFALSDTETRRLCALVQREASTLVAQAAIEACRVFYPAFQAGLWDLAARDPASPSRAAATDRTALYARALARAVGAGA